MSCEKGDWQYKVFESGEVTITAYVGTDADITIPASLEGRKVTGIGMSAFGDCSSLTSVIIPEGVTHIGDQTFLGCERLSSITISKSVTSIGEEAFEQCSEELVISCETGSYAEEYAKANGLSYENVVTSICRSRRRIIRIPRRH